MIQQEWLNKGFPVKTIWKPLEIYKDTANIVQVYGVCFTKDGEVMIIRNKLSNNSYTPWYLPGGTPENNETPEQTLIREVDEEADISITDLKLLGTFEVHFPNNPNKQKGDIYNQLRYFALIKDIREQTIDPHDNEMVERNLIPANEFNKYVKWGNVGDELIRLAIQEYEKRSSKNNTN